MLNIILSSTILIAGILFIRFLFHDNINPNLKYSLWGIVAFRLILFDLPLINIFKSPLSVQNIIISAQSSDGRNILLPQNLTAVENPTLMTGSDVITNIDLTNSILSFNWYGLLMWIWIIGVVLFLSWFIILNFTFSKKVFQSRKLLDFKVTNLDLKHLSVYQSDSLSSPCLMRYRCETNIYVTSDIAKDEEKLYYAVAHELCHKKHHDILWGYVRIFLLSIYWFHPFVWISAVISKRDCETACDYEVIQMIGDDKRIAYGKTLVLLAQTQQQHNPFPVNITTMMCETENGLKTRIKLIIKNQKMLPITFFLVLLFTVIMIVSTFTGESPTNEPVSEEAQIQESKDSNEAISLDETSIKLEKRMELEEFALNWATAYTTKKADLIYDLCADKKLYETFGYTEVGYRWIGSSSPWPNQAIDNNFLSVIEDDGTIQIYYSHAASDPHIFVEKETLVAEKIDGIYKAISRDSTFYNTVTSKRDFEEAYEYRYPIFADYTKIYQMRADEMTEKKEIFCDPISMAENLLNLSGATSELISKKEGIAEIQFTWEDGSILVNMIQPDIIGADGIWIAIFDEVNHLETERGIK